MDLSAAVSFIQVTEDETTTAITGEIGFFRLNVQAITKNSLFTVFFYKLETIQYIMVMILTFLLRCLRHRLQA
jgi:hypothetical protein